MPTEYDPPAAAAAAAAAAAVAAAAAAAVAVAAAAAAVPAAAACCCIEQLLSSGDKNEGCCALSVLFGSYGVVPTHFFIFRHTTHMTRFHIYMIRAPVYVPAVCTIQLRTYNCSPYTEYINTLQQYAACSTRRSGRGWYLP